MAPAGEYKLGAEGVRTNPPHTAALKAFAIAEAETTNAQFAAFVKATNYKREAAARAGAATKYPWGDTFDHKRANIWNGATHRADTKLDGFLYTAPVKSFPPNAWGLYDVIGNVFEYCGNLPPWMNPEDARRLIAGRGGSWWCSAGTCSFFNLVDIGSMDRQGSLANQGFRVVFDAEKAAAFPEVKAKEPALPH